MGQVLGDPVAAVLLDRLLQYTVVIQVEGSSYRLRQHADLIPEQLRSKTLINPSIAAGHAPPSRTPAQNYRQPINRPPGEFYLGTNEESSLGIDTSTQNCVRSVFCHAGTARLTQSIITTR